jgi:hypothetical protein
MTTTSIPPAPPAAPSAPTAPRPRPAPRQTSSANARDERMRRIQLIMFTSGGVLMPFGILAICLGWYGSAHSHYEYDQNTYLVSGGILGLGLTFLGGFLYFGAWLSRMATDQRRSSAQLTDAMLVPAAEPEPELVRAGNNATVHRRTCALIAARPDLHAFVDDGGPVTTCRVCKPEL